MWLLDHGDAKSERALRVPAVHTACDETDLDALAAELVRVEKEVPAEGEMQPPECQRVVAQAIAR